MIWRFLNIMKHYDKLQGHNKERKNHQYADNNCTPLAYFEKFSILDRADAKFYSTYIPPHKNCNLVLKLLTAPPSNDEWCSSSSVYNFHIVLKIAYLVSKSKAYRKVVKIKASQFVPSPLLLCAEHLLQSTVCSFLIYNYPYLMFNMNWLSIVDQCATLRKFFPIGHFEMHSWIWVSFKLLWFLWVNFTAGF